jgi:hypothetical protein
VGDSDSVTRSQLRPQRDGPWRIFLSHTSDLRDHPRDRSFVAAAEAAVMRAGHAIVDMAYFAARDTEPADYCTEMVGGADVYVAIVGHRYGAPVSARPDLSYTELEFEAATTLGLPRLIFLVRDGVTGMPPARQHADRQMAFRRRLQESDLTTAWVASPGELEIGLHQSLVELRAGRRVQRSSPPRRIRTARELSRTPPAILTPIVAFWTRLDQPDIGEAIALLRQQFGLTRAELVERMWAASDDANLGLDTSLIYRWERGEKGRRRPRPSDQYRRLLGLVCEGQMQSLSPIGRREFLRRLAMLAGSQLLSGPVILDTPMPLHAGAPDPQLLDGMAALTRNYLHLHNTVSPSAVRAAIARHFDELTALALRSHSPSTAVRIRSMSAQTAILAGWVSFNLQDMSQALMYWTVAHEMAREAGNVSLQAHALGCRSRLYSPIHRGADQTDPAVALALLDQAVYLSDGAASPALRSWLLANRAQQFAATNQADASFRDLDASAHFASTGEQSDDDMLSGWDEVRVDAYRGICAMVLRRPADVIAVTESVLARTDPSRVQRSLQQCDLAAAYAMQGDVDQACSLLTEALRMAARAQFPEGTRRVLSVRGEYLREQRSPSIQQLDDLITTTVTSST